MYTCLKLRFYVKYWFSRFADVVLFIVVKGRLFIPVAVSICTICIMLMFFCVY